MKQLAIRERFHEEFGIQLEEEAVEEWRDLETGIHDRMDMASGITLQSPQKITVSISDLRASAEEVRREFEANKSYIKNQIENWAIVDEGSAELSKSGDFRAKFTLKYTG